MSYIKDMLNRISLQDSKDLLKRFPSEIVEELLGIIEDYHRVVDEVNFELGI